jgi:hypothetical protein
MAERRNVCGLSRVSVKGVRELVDFWGVRTWAMSVGVGCEYIWRNTACLSNWGLYGF